MNLRRRIMLFFALVIGLLSIVCLPTFYWVTGGHLKDQFFKSYAYQIDQVLATINHFFLERRGDVFYGASLFSSLSPSDLPEAEKKVQKLFAAHPVYRSLSVFLPNGEKVVDSGGVGLGEISRASFIARALASESVILDFESAKENGASTLVFGKSIVHDGQVLGVLAAYVEAGKVFLQDDIRFDDSNYWKGTEFKLIQKAFKNTLYENSQGTISFDHNYLRELSSAQFPSGKQQSVLVEDQDGFFVFVGEGDTFNDLGFGNWQILARIKKSEIFAPVNKIVVILGLMFVILLASALGGMYWLYSRLFSPLVTLSDRILRFGQGEYDVFNEIAQKNDEISMMARHLNNMSGNLKKSMTELSQQSRLSAIGQMAGGIAHEVNNPLSIIIMRADILSQMIGRGTVDPKEIKAGLEKITETAVRISKIIKGLRALSRGGNHEAFSEVYVNSVISSTLELCEQSVKNKDINIRPVQNTADPRFECRPVQISQVLLNLINNAVDEIKNLPFEERWVEIRVKDLGEQVLVQVLNGGPKVSEEVANKMFQPFFTTKGAGEGTGLGLSISKQIMSSHSGQIQVDLSEANTCVALTFPKVQPVNSDSEDSSDHSAA
ncbi:MAG: GHKL domain-containing protein [Bdellovibrionaceae bacterium]|nr:GHKL domain-containing protein [Pseudobdellovibrionaceae bacterium]